MSKLVALLRLTRAEHSIMLIIAVIAAEFIAKGIPSPSLLVLSLIAPASISMASFAINDYFDVAVDKANKRMRPIVTGELTKDDALLVTAAGMLIGIIASAFINVQCFAIALIFGILALLYSYRLKRSSYWSKLEMIVYQPFLPVSVHPAEYRPYLRAYGYFLSVFDYVSLNAGALIKLYYAYEIWAFPLERVCRRVCPGVRVYGPVAAKLPALHLRMPSAFPAYYPLWEVNRAAVLAFVCQKIVALFHSPP